MLEILVIEDDPEMREVLVDDLRDAGHQLESAGDGQTALERIALKTFDLVVCDVQLPRVDGFTLMRKLRTESPSTDVILMTAFAEVSQAVSALKEGATDYLIKPFSLDELHLRVQRIGERKDLQRELAKARADIDDRDTTLVGDSPAMRRAIEMVKMVALSDVSALITGESGTGKELIARMLHERSSRKSKPFIVVNCGALAENLIEAELFGHERGAFTGAVKKRDGRFKAADGGTLFMDEIAELPLAAQASLLRVLQEGTFEPIGTNQQVKVDVRVVSATHRNLRDRVKSGAFREDLFYRINVIEIPLPPLRERPGDLVLLLGHCLRKLVPKGTPLPSLTPAAWAALMQYPFPGNVREFSHAIEHALVLSGAKEIDVFHLPPAISFTQAGARESGAVIAIGEPVLRSLQDALRDFELHYLQRALKLTGGKRVLAAQMLGISRKTLWEKLRNTELSNDADDAIEVGVSPGVA